MDSVEKGSDSVESRGKMWELDQRLDQPLGMEAVQVRGMEQRKVLPASAVVRLAFLSLGVVYGDLGTSSLYVFSSIFPDGIKDTEDILGALSLIIYTITLIALVKYVFIVLKADDNGEGGTFALYSLICRHAKVNIIPNQHPTDEELTTYSCGRMGDKSRAFKIRRVLERNAILQKMLLILVLLGTCMVIGDGILTPAISVLSSVSGIKAAHPAFRQGHVVILALIILVILFSMQHFGTGKVGFMFAPIILLWFISTGLVGIYNIIKHDPSIFRALSPMHILDFFKRRKEDGWVSLGGVVLSITGAEALFADLGHFTTFSIQVAFTMVVFPCLLLAYIGQGAYLMKFPQHVSETFYKSIPSSVFWPMFIVATIAAIVASQATISATFSIIKQSVALGCFPRMKIVHTSHQFGGRIYVPEINWILMGLCLAITAGFQDTTQIGNAYGIAVVAVMLVTTILMTLIMLFIWQSNLLLVALFFVVFGSVELIYFSSVLFKVESGGWVPLAIACILLVIMYAWHYGTAKRYEFENQNKVPIGWILGLGPSLGLVRLPGIGLLYTQLAHGVPPIFSHFITHLPAIHSVVIFVCVKYLPVNTVPQEERILFRRIGTADYWMYRCVVRYGYMDLHKKDDNFEQILLEGLAEFLRCESFVDSLTHSEVPSDYSLTVTPEDTLPSAGTRREYQHNNIGSELSGDQGFSPETVRSQDLMPVIEDQLKFLWDAREVGVVHILGNTIVRAREGSNIMKKIAINNIYAFLRKICRGSNVIYHIPHESLLNVGMVHYV